MKRLGPAPPGTTGFFIGDENAGSGWEIKRSDGTTDKYYVDLPPDIGESFVHLPEAPEQYRGVAAQQLLEKYLCYLGELIAEAKNRFGG